MSDKIEFKSNEQSLKENQQENQQESQQESQEEETQNDFLEDQIELCIFCNVKLNYGFDENEMLHCQNCHNIWDGNAQCNCF
jgi:hypothetical protein